MYNIFLPLIIAVGFWGCSFHNSSDNNKKQCDLNNGGIVNVASLQELASYASKSNVNIKMLPGEYTLNDTLLSQSLIIKKYKDGKIGSDYPIATLIHFSGNNSYYELSGVTIKIDSKLHQKFGNSHLFEIFVSGDNNTINGLKVKDIGDDAPTKGAIMMHVMGDDNTISNTELFINGSYPYGYGHLLGKGGKTIVNHKKHSSLLVSGINTKLLSCKVVTHAFGHGIVMQGAQNTLIKDCYVEGEMRSTDDMLAETSGPAYSVGFKSDYPPGEIMPNEMKSLAEDGVRTYPYGYLVGRKTKGVTVINTTVKNMRSGFDLGANQPPTKIIDCTAIGCQEKGYAVIKDAIIKNCKGDAKYGPLLTFQGNRAENCEVELELINTESKYPINRIAEINGKGHMITLKNHKELKRTTGIPIVFGASFWSDVHRYRKPDNDPSEFSGAYDITLINETGMPVVFEELSSGCNVVSNGKLLKDNGENNQLTYSQIVDK
ncbi:hypothetical protein [Saccharicrinis sp. 156]|uniref:hypothetical protein n=1 Tax=Saccharicrinis sp. 156 TaxID=3417574 RepID=UPI003D32C5F3